MGWPTVHVANPILAIHMTQKLSVQGSCRETVRLQHTAPGTDKASTSGVVGLTPCTTCAYINPQTAKQALLADADLVLVSKHQSRSKSICNALTQAVAASSDCIVTCQTSEPDAHAIQHFVCFLLACMGTHLFLLCPYLAVVLA